MLRLFSQPKYLFLTDINKINKLVLNSNRDYESHVVSFY